MLTLPQVTDFLNQTPQNPTVSDTIKRWRNVYYGVSLHTTGAAPKFKDPSVGEVTPASYFGQEYQLLFDRFLLNSYPLESADIRNWRYSQYRPYTKAPMQTIIETVAGGMFQDSNYQIELNNVDDNRYIWESSFCGKDLIRFFEWSLKSVFEDPNGAFVRIPKQAWNKTTTDRIEPDIWFVYSKNIYTLTKDDFIFKHEGFVYWINKVAIFQYYLTKDAAGKDEWRLTDPSGYYAHMLGRLPVSVAGGTWNTMGFFDSYMDKAKAAADDFIPSKSMEQLIDRDSGYPTIIEADAECDECDGLGKNQIETDRGWEKVTCKKCNGKKRISRNPGQRMLAPKEDMIKGSELVQRVNPDISINKHHFEKNKEIYWSILDALNLTKIDQAQSGVAKTIDQERLHQFISFVSNDYFDRVIYETLRDIIAYRNISVVNGEIKPSVYQFTLVKPSQFQIKGASDLLLEYADGGKANLPGFLRKKAMVAYADKQYGGDMILKKQADIISQMDNICWTTPDDRSSMLLNGEITQEDAKFTVALPGILDEIVREKGSEWFIKADYDMINTEVKAKFVIDKPRIPALQDANTQ